MSLLTVPIVKSSHILAGIYFTFQKNLLDQTRKSCNTKFRSQWRDRKNSYHEKKILTIFRKLVTPILTVCSYHLTYALQSESTLYICLNVKELLPWNKRDICNLSDCNGTRIHNHLVPKQTLNRLAKLTINWADLWVRIGTVHLTVCSYHVPTRSRVNPNSIFPLMSRNTLLEIAAISEV